MPSNTNGNFFTHKRVAVVHASHVALLLHTTPASAAVALTARTTNAITGSLPFRETVAVTTQTGTGWGVLTQAYSYDAVIHLEAYRSDV